MTQYTFLITFQNGMQQTRICVVDESWGLTSLVNSLIQELDPQSIDLLSFTNIIA